MALRSLTELFPNIENRRVPWRRGPFFVPHGGAAAPSLDLNFMMTPGTLDSRITFTRASTATYFDVSGVMQTAATNAPRWDYDPVTHALRGLLIEEARTNVLLNSGDLSNASWSNELARTTVTGNNVTAPDGTLTAARLVFPAVNDAATRAFVRQAGTGGSPPTGSIYLRGAVGGEQLYLFFTNFTLYYSQRITLTTAWQRFSYYAPSAVTAFSLCVGCDPRDVTQTTMPAQTVYAWGAQTEAGAFPTSYIPTTAATATRAVEQAYIPTAGWFTSTTYSLAVEFDTVLAARCPGGIGDTVFANASYFVNSGFIRNATASSNAITVGAITKQCGTLVPATTIQCCNNGGTVGANSTSVAAAQSTATRLTIGCSPWAMDNQICGHIRRIQYWPRVLSNAELQQVTT